MNFEAEKSVCPRCGHRSEELALVATANDGIEAEIIEAKLKAADIPVLTRYRESGDFLKIYMGNSCFGVDLYVPASLKEEAQEILSINEISPEEIKEEDLYITQKTVETDQRNMTLFVVGVLVVFIILFFVLSKGIG
jgi:predicted DNA-binding protein (UPF0278 family)